MSLFICWFFFRQPAGSVKNFLRLLAELASSTGSLSRKIRTYFNAKSELKLEINEIRILPINRVHIDGAHLGDKIRSIGTHNIRTHKTYSRAQIRFGRVAFVSSMNSTNLILSFYLLIHIIAAKLSGINFIVFVLVSVARSIKVIKIV